MIHCEVCGLLIPSSRELDDYVTCSKKCAEEFLVLKRTVKPLSTLNKDEEKYIKKSDDYFLDSYYSLH